MGEGQNFPLLEIDPVPRTRLRDSACETVRPHQCDGEKQPDFFGQVGQHSADFFKLRTHTHEDENLVANL